MQKVANYGSFIQSYALKQVLLKLGVDEVYFIDIKKGEILQGLGQNNILRRIKRLFAIFFSGRVIDRIKESSFIRHLDESFNGTYDLLGQTTEDINSLDLIIIGSDEVFNCCQVSPWGFSTQLFGDIPGAKNIVSYAASFGGTSYEMLVKYNIIDKIKGSLANLKKISVRDRNSSEIIGKIGFHSEINLDPVLIWGGDSLLPSLKPIDGEYLLVYSYPYRIRNKDEVDAIVRFSKQKKLRIVPILCQYRWSEKAVFPNPPLDVLRYFKGAKYIVTDTFHGTIFSVISHKQFCTIIRDSNKNKMESLLTKLDLVDRAYTPLSSINDILEKCIDYNHVEGILQDERKKTYDYLLRCIDNIKNIKS